MVIGKKLATTFGAMAVGVTMLAAPSAAWASIPPGDGGGAAPCTAYVTPSKAGDYIYVRIRVYSCYVRAMRVDTHFQDETNPHGPTGDWGFVSEVSSFTKTYRKSIAGHTGDKYSAYTVTTIPWNGGARTFTDHGTT